MIAIAMILLAAFAGAAAGWRVCAWERDRDATAMLTGLVLAGYLSKAVVERLRRDPAEVHRVLELGNGRRAAP